MKPTEQTKRHVIAAYVIPARQRGEKTIRVGVGKVQKELGWTNRTPSVYSTLSSKEFQSAAGVALIEKVGGPPSGGPSTTWKFVYRVLSEAENATVDEVAGNRSSLMDLYGLCAETFNALGGGEDFLRREREWSPDVWERYATEERERKSGKAAE
jgi:hypothetical protein